MRAFWKKFFKIGLIVGIICLAFTIFYLGLCFVLSPVKFDKNKVTNANVSLNLYDKDNRPLEHTYINGDYVKLNEIPDYTKNCFISIEDKKFYKHNGINFKRILSATAKNLISFSFKEGASTISQQLIKNTHLSSEKSIKRKINEIKLTYQLEKNFSKDEIFEYYLNTIYFGDNCYGIQNASEHYFSKPVSKLTIDESALLAGIIKSPNRYHPVKNYSNSIKRRNIVLSELYDDKKISKQEYETSLKLSTEIITNANKNEMNAYAKATIKEAEDILKIPEKQIALSGYRIYTYMDNEKQSSIENSIDKNLNADCSMISINSHNGNIEAYTEKSNLSIINMQRQPASAIKPLLVYATAINENIISPSTVILDENVSINGYEPRNIGGKEHGYVSAKESLSNSYNIPAVKILSYVGLDKAKSYLMRQNIKFDEKDNNLALALGGMTYGTTLKDLTNCYQTLANGGKYIQAKFISHILNKDGKVVYKNRAINKNIYRDDTSFLVTDMLHQCTKTGTAKRLSDLDFYIASKTGTSSISKKNLDTYNISYTSEDVVGCWVGNVDNTPIDIVGGGTPTAFVKDYLKKIYINHKPQAITPPSSVTLEEIDTIARDNERIIYRANNYLPERYREKAYFSRFNMPKTNVGNHIEIKPLSINGKINNGVAIITFNAEIYYSYDIYAIVDNKETLIGHISDKNGNASFNISQEPNKVVKYYIKCKGTNYTTHNTNIINVSNTLELYYRA